MSDALAIIAAHRRVIDDPLAVALCSCGTAGQIGYLEQAQEWHDRHLAASLAASDPTPALFTATDPDGVEYEGGFAQPAPEADEREALTALADEWERVGGYGTIQAGKLRALFARRSQPAPEADEREALARVIWAAGTPFGPDEEPEDTNDWRPWLVEADAVLAAGFRHSQPAPRTVSAAQRRTDAANAVRHLAAMSETVWPLSGRIASWARAIADGMAEGRFDAALGITVEES